MTIPIKTNRTDDALSYLNTQWQEKPIILGLVTAWMQSFQSVEDTLFQLLNDRGIHTAAGVQLDTLGVIANVSRNGDTDDEYRGRLLTKFNSLGGSGTPNEIIDLIQSLVEGTANIFEYYPAQYYAHTTGFAYHSTYEAIRESSVAGVGSRLLFSSAGQSFVGTPVIDTTDSLVLENGDSVRLSNTSDTLFMQSQMGLLVDPHTYFPALEQVSEGLSDNSGFFCAILPPISPTLIDRGRLIFENDDLIELDNGDTFTYQIIEGT